MYFEVILDGILDGILKIVYPFSYGWFDHKIYDQTIPMLMDKQMRIYNPVS